MSAAYVYTPVERTSRRLGLFLLLLIGLLLTVTLFIVKTRAQDARADVARLEAQIEQAERDISVLSAEKAVLANPERLRGLAEERLSLEPIKVAQTRALESLDDAP